jgi:hypothetical protein
MNGSKGTFPTIGCDLGFTDVGVGNLIVSCPNKVDELAQVIGPYSRHQPSKPAHQLGTDRQDWLTGG